MHRLKHRIIEVIGAFFDRRIIERIVESSRSVPLGRRGISFAPFVDHESSRRTPGANGRLCGSLAPALCRAYLTIPIAQRESPDNIRTLRHPRQRTIAPAQTRSHDEFVAKLGIVSEEADESVFSARDYSTRRSTARQSNSGTLLRRRNNSRASSARRIERRKRKRR